MSAPYIDKRDECDRFMSRIAHDLIGPLRHIKLFSAALMETLPGELTAEQKKYAGFVTQGVEDAQRRLEALRNFSNVIVREREPQVVDCTALLQEITIELKDEIEAKHATIDAGALPTVIADVAQLKQLFIELIENALIHTGEKPTIKISGAEVNGGWNFTVEDNGPGIEPLYHAKLFDPFQRLENSPEGEHCGMGLAMAQRIAQLHGGKVEIASESGKGCRFTVFLAR